ncbi:hypothetical protein ACQUWM_07265 [Marinobacter sp. DUT-3]|uniref:hypothetical protein n=1 Tax=Marinobacter sp. DUT-3 TaxID=3412036 RepID=UPI003D17963A
MKIGDFLYFAPNIRFSQVDLSGEQLPRQYASRVEGFYLTPAALLADSGHGFASGLLVLTAIDALARLSREEERVGARVKAWLGNELRGLHNPRQADALYSEVRNGLVHEARLKAGVEFSLEQETLVNEGPVVSFNPRILLSEVREALSRLVDQLESDAAARQAFLDRLKEEFVFELQGLRGANRPTRPSSRRG